MCDIRPGTRCAYDMRTKVTKRQERLDIAMSSYGKESPEADLAEARLNLSELHYDATREGLKKLESQLLKHEFDEELMHRYKTAKILNLTQSLSVKEVKNGRLENISNFISEVYDQPSEEVYSILDSARYQQERKVVESLDESQGELIPSETWNQYVNSLTKNSKNSEAAEKLKSMTPPPLYVFKTYSNYETLAAISAKHLNNEYKHISDITGADIKDIKEAHSRLKEEYRNMETKPSVPESWIRGESNNMGIANNPKMMFAPTDAASNYATYSLIHNESSLPDYQKRARNFVTMTQSGNEVEAKFYSTSGKFLYSRRYDKTTDAISRLKQDCEGTLLLTERMNKNHMSLEEIAVNHLDLPYYKKSLVQGALKASEDSNIVELYLKTLSNAKRTWSKKAPKARTLTTA